MTTTASWERHNRLSPSAREDVEGAESWAIKGPLMAQKVTETNCDHSEESLISGISQP
jgi:hypothetical protein